MPSSCDSDQSSSPSLISSLRNFRFQSRNRPYVPSSPSPASSPLCANSPRVRSVIGIVPETPDSQKPGSLQSSPGSTESESKPRPKNPVKPRKCSESTSIPSVNNSPLESEIKSSSLASSSPLSSIKSSPSETKGASSQSCSVPSSPLSVRNCTKKKEALSTEKLYLFLLRVIPKLEQTFENCQGDAADLELSSEDVRRLKIELSCKHTDLFLRWESNVTEDADSSASCSDSSGSAIKIKRSYLNELLKACNNKKRNKTTVSSKQSIASAVSEISNFKASVKTYTRAIKNTTVSDNCDNKLSIAGCILASTVDNYRLDTITKGHKQLAMDDYEVFCEKETNLRHLLDAFPGADIMEAQDILVTCKWDLKKAIQVANQKPLKTTRKRLGSTHEETPESKKPTNDGHINNNFLAGLKAGASTSTPKPAEEIVLDSSDEDTDDGMNSSKTKNNIESRSTGSTLVLPPAKKTKRILSSSSSSAEESFTFASSHSSLPGVKTLSLTDDMDVSPQKSLITKTVQKQNLNKSAKPASVQPTISQNVNKQVVKQISTQSIVASENVNKQAAKPVLKQSMSIQEVKQPAKLALSQSVSIQEVKQPAKPALPQSVSIQEVKQPAKPSLSQSVSIQEVKQPAKPSLSQSVSIQEVRQPALTALPQSLSVQEVNQATMPTLPQSISIQEVKQPIKLKLSLPVSIKDVKLSTKQTMSIQSVKPASQSTKVSNDKTANSAANEQTVTSTLNSKSTVNVDSMPNLPKGLVITQIQASVQPTADSKEITASSAENVNMKSLSKSISLTPISSSVSITPSFVNSDVKFTSNSMTIKETVNSVKETDNSIKQAGKSVKQTENSVKVMTNSFEQTKNSVSIMPANSETEKPAGTESVSKSKPSKDRKRIDYEEEEEEEYYNEILYDSEESDSEDNLSAQHSTVLSFFQDATNEELATVPGCSKKKVDAIVNIRPFKGWFDLVQKLKNEKMLSTDLLNGAKKVIDMRNAISRLMTKCQQISLDMEDLVEDLKENKETSTDYVSKQPDLLNDKMHLTSYQMLGLNWLLLMHNQEVNGILADEMGLGKTVQATAFLAYLKQINIFGPHLIVVPSSTLDNWQKELHTWWPTVSVICYHGSQDSRRELRMQILNDEVDDFDVMVTTYNMVTSSAEDRNFFKRLEFHYVIFDEAHMLKNMASQRYQNLMRIKAPRRLLLTGTPLQNNLVELMSLLIFAMPHMFSGKTEQIKQMFSCVCKSDESKGSFERDKIEHAKRIMKPFVLRRLKCDVLKELPAKHEETKLCAMSEDQAQKYHELITTFSEEVQNNKEKDASSSGAGMMMQLRRAANHPLLLRRHFNDDKLLKMSKLMLKEPTHTQNDPNLIFEDMCVMSDFELHKLCKSYKSLKEYVLSNEMIMDSGKFKILENMLPKLIEEDHRILLFSQFTMVLDVVQEYMDIKEYKFLRLDGQVPVTERQQLIDEFNSDPDIPVFLLSTRAGGLGINLTAADTVILHDIDFNPYNDKQAEDRCHRVGQIRDVRVIRFISEDTIEEGILQRAKEKLKLERDIHAEDETEENDVASVAKLLRDALGISSTKS